MREWLRKVASCFLFPTKRVSWEWESEDCWTPKHYLAFVDRCRKAGICLPTWRMAQAEAQCASFYPIGDKRGVRYWAGHDQDAKVYWFTYGIDMGAMIHLLEPDRVPTMTVPYAPDCDVCLNAKWHPNRGGYGVEGDVLESEIHKDGTREIQKATPGSMK